MPSYKTICKVTSLLDLEPFITIGSGGHFACNA